MNNQFMKRLKRSRVWRLGGLYNKGEKRSGNSMVDWRRIRWVLWTASPAQNRRLQGVTSPWPRLTRARRSGMILRWRMSRWGGHRNQRRFLKVIAYCFMIPFLFILLLGALWRVVPANMAIPSERLSAEVIPRMIEPDPSITDQLVVSVFLSEQDRIIDIPLEQYVAGVVAAEMPIEFELEALKAQAIVSRTYLVRRYMDRLQTDAGGDNQGLVTDTAAHQVYVTETERLKKWGQQQYTANMEKINRAVNETAGWVLTWEGEPINATFFSTSNGMTENSEDYWMVAEPYLRSVSSPWDEKVSPRYSETMSLAADDVLRKLGIAKRPLQNPFAITVTERTTGNRVKQIRIADQIFSGREVREKLGLNSSHFEWKWDGDQIRFTTYGYGHGVGMSQWGAEGMARLGADARQIVQYYYTGITISQLSQLLEQ